MMDYTYFVNCLISNLKLIREFVQESLKDFDLSDIEKHQLVLAVDEICANLIIHSHSGDPQSVIEIHIQDKKDGILFEIIDQDSEYFDPNKHKNDDVVNIMRNRHKGGMGLMLVQRIVDNIEVTNESRKNVWRLYKNIEPNT